jgi:hypothetical protein
VAGLGSKPGADRAEDPRSESRHQVPHSQKFDQVRPHGFCQPTIQPHSTSQMSLNDAGGIKITAATDFVLMRSFRGRWVSGRPRIFDFLPGEFCRSAIQRYF